MPKALVSIRGFDFPEPSSYDANTATIVDSARNLNGYVSGSVIRNDVAKVTIGWKYLTVEQWAAILACFDPALGGYFYNEVEFFNQATGQWTTRTMYVSDRNTGGMFRRDPETGDVLGWKAPKLSLIEV